MKYIQYISDFQTQDIDIVRLRPGKSYDYLIENRNESLRDVFSDQDKLGECLKKRMCPGCLSDKFGYLFEKDSLTIVQCNECDLVYVNPVFDNDKYIELYKSENYQEIVKQLGEESHEYRKRRFGKERIDVIEKYHNSELSKSLLEIGCSTGFVLEEAAERGWDAVGVELNPSAVDFGNKRGLTIINKPLEQIKFTRKFSAIALYDVLEHLIDPIHLLETLREALEPGGKIYVYVPNFNSASKQLLGVKNAHFIWPSHHLTYFTPKTLKQFLERKQFKVFHWETQGLDLYDWQWYLDEKTEYDTMLLKLNIDALQFYVNASGHGKNLRMYAELSLE